MLSVPEIKLLMDLVLDHADQFSDQGFKQVVTFAQNIRKSTNHGDLFKHGTSLRLQALSNICFLSHEQKAGHSVQVVKTCCAPWTLSLTDCGFGAKIHILI